MAADDGWDVIAIAGAIIYIQRKFGISSAKLEKEMLCSFFGAQRLKTNTTNLSLVGFELS